MFSVPEELVVLVAVAVVASKAVVTPERSDRLDRMDLGNGATGGTSRMFTLKKNLEDVLSGGVTISVRTFLRNVYVTYVEASKVCPRYWKVPVRGPLN
jgi:hypothetical protein